MRWSWRLFACAAVSSVFSTPCLAGAFLQPPGAGLLILTTNFAAANKAYDERGMLVSARSYDKFETRAYFEYGLFEQLTFVAESSFLRFRGAPRSRGPEDIEILKEQALAGAPLALPELSPTRYAGLGAGWLGARLRLFEWGATVLSAQASLRAATPAAREYADVRQRLQQDVRLQFALPIQLFGMPGFGEAQLGFRSEGRSGAEFRADITYGLRPLDSILLLAQSFTVVSPADARSGFFFSEKFQLSVVYDLDPRISVQIGGIASVRGVNDSAERGVVTALWYRF